jgi:hypothetical protein
MCLLPRRRHDAEDHRHQRDRDFREGETVFDVDGNSYTVRGGYAELNINDMIRYNLNDGEMRNCFSRENNA